LYSLYIIKKKVYDFTKGNKVFLGYSGLFCPMGQAGNMNAIAPDSMLALILIVVTREVLGSEESYLRSPACCISLIQQNEFHGNV